MPNKNDETKIDKGATLENKSEDPGPAMGGDQPDGTNDNQQVDPAMTQGTTVAGPGVGPPASDEGHPARPIGHAPDEATGPTPLGHPEPER